VNQPLKVGLIGVGGFGATHLKALQQLEMEGLVQLVCVTDPRSEALADTRRALEVRGIRWHADYRSLLERESEIEAVSIAAPIHLHMEITAAAIARGLFVYLEKPPVPLLQQLNELISLDARKQVAVGFQLIHSHPVQQVKLWRTQAALGDIRSIRVHGCVPRPAAYYARAPWAGKMVFEGLPVFDGPATNALSHWLHNIMYLAGEQMDTFAVPTQIEAELYRVKPIESYDTICMRGRFASNASFYYAVTHATQELLRCRLEIEGSNGRAWIVESSSIAGNNLGLSESVKPCADPFEESWRQFVRFTRGERAAMTSLEDTRGYTLATNAALESSGGIHPCDWAAPAEVTDEQNRTDELARLIEHSVREGRLFSEMNIPWARSGKPVRTADLPLGAMTQVGWKGVDQHGT
jgi:predicted dehydrogenase